MICATNYENVFKFVLKLPIQYCRLFFPDTVYLQQDAQLSLRNRASAMHFFVAKLFSIAVMTYMYVYHLRNLRPVIRLICYAHGE